MKTIKINSGFQWGGSLLSWDGRKFITLAKASENTRCDDGDSSFTAEVPDDFKGAKVLFWGISSISYCNSAELIGFSPEELCVPSPVRGWASAHGQSINSSDDWRLNTMGDYLIALARNASISSIDEILKDGGGENAHPSGNGKILVHLGMEAGDQEADSFAVLDEYGNILEEVSGTGYNTPYPILRADGWEFSSKEEDGTRDKAEVQARMNASLKKGWSDEWVDVAQHLRSSYRLNQNPLKGLRKKYGGRWIYYGVGTAPEDNIRGSIRFTALSDKDCERLPAPDGYSGFWGNVWGRWQVIYIPAGV